MVINIRHVIMSITIKTSSSEVQISTVTNKFRKIDNLRKHILFDDAIRYK